jgi:hypothetical protein
MEIEFRRSFIKTTKSVPGIKAYPMTAPVTGFPDIMIQCGNRFALVELKMASDCKRPEIRPAQRQFWASYVAEGGVLFIAVADETNEDGNSYYVIRVDKILEKELPLSASLTTRKIMDLISDRNLCRRYKTVRGAVLEISEYIKEL